VNLKEIIDFIGEIFAFNVNIEFAFLLGIIYIIAFLGAVYYGIDLCAEFQSSYINKWIKVVLALTPIAIIMYPTLIHLYPNDIITINATMGILEIVSIIYIILIQSIQLLFILIFKGFLFGFKVALYVYIIAIILSILNIKMYNFDMLVYASIALNIYQSRESLKNTFSRINGNLIYNLKCLFSIK